MYMELEYCWQSTYFGPYVDIDIYVVLYCETILHFYFYLQQIKTLIQNFGILFSVRVYLSRVEFNTYSPMFFYLEMVELVASTRD